MQYYFSRSSACGSPSSEEDAPRAKHSACSTLATLSSYGYKSIPSSLRKENIAFWKPNAILEILPSSLTPK